MNRITYVGIIIVVGTLLAVGGISWVYAESGATSRSQASGISSSVNSANAGKFTGIVSGPGAAYFRGHQMLAQAKGVTQSNQDYVLNEDSVDQDLADVGKFRGSLGRMFGGYMRSGRGFNQPPYVSPDDPKTGASCGQGGPFESRFGVIPPPGQGC